MKTKKCRVCGNELFDKPLLSYSNMPARAQYLPDLKLLKTDKGVDLEICQCSGCGLVQLSNDPVPYYREVIRAAAASDEMKKFRMKQFRKFVKKFHLKGKKVVEIGCGRGEYLSIMQQAGADAYGLEYSAESVKHCIKNGLKVSKGFIGDRRTKLKNSPFDAFFILNFLEHLPDPNVMLMGMFNNLMDNGIGLIEVPNFDMMLQKKLFSEFIGDHLFYFTKETLGSILNQNGFEIIDCNEIWHDYIISAIVKKRAKTDLSHFDEIKIKIKNEIDEYICRFKNNGVAVWGAGHQALAVMSLLRLEQKIKYVVDSALFKQGKFTPATHIPIVSPDSLDLDPVGAVVIMAASYSDEVAKIIRQKHDKNINIAILRDFGLEIIK